MAGNDERKEEWWRQTRWWIPGAILVLLVVVDLVAAFRFTSDKDLRGSILGLLTPVVALLAGGAALLNFQETRRQNDRTFETMQRELELARDQFTKSQELQQRGQVTDRFSKAIEQLGQEGDGKLDVRIGAIYALEQIAHDSEQLHWPVMEVLTAYVRQHARWLPEPQPEATGRQPGQVSTEASEQSQTYSQRRRMPTDVQAVIAVLGRRRARADELRLDLSSTDLRWGRFAGADKGNFRNADFRGACLKGAELQETDLEGACFAEPGVGEHDAMGLTREQLERAKNVDKAVLPSYILKAREKQPDSR